MSENTLQIIAVGKLLWVVGFAALYGFGGISNKWLRRFVGAFWMGIGIFGFSQWSHLFHWWFLLYPLFLCASLHMGYGGETIWQKIERRFVYGLALGISALPLVFGSHHFGLFGIHLSLCVSASVLFGVFNPTGDARSEEALIAALSTAIPLFLI